MPIHYETVNGAGKGPSTLVSSLFDFLGSPLSTLSGGANRWRLAHWAELVPKIGALEPELLKLNDEQLRKRSLSLRYRAKSGEPLARLLVEAYALVREAGRRTINMRHFDVQILGGIAMFHRSIVEMQTGEGKTLAATLPMYLHALIGKGCHLATVNDYLARRDAEWMGPIYQALGMTVGVVETQMSQAERRKAYACDVTYGTAKEFGFDFLRDRLLLRRIREGQTDLLGGMLGHRQRGERKAGAGRRLFRPGRRGRQHPDRRGPHAADHQRLADRGAEAGGGVLQVERVGRRRVRRGRGLRVRPREEDRRADPRGPAEGPHAAQAAETWTPWAWSTSTSTSSGRSWSIASTTSTGSTSSATARS